MARVLVVGPPRSGTSAVAGICATLGVDMGEPPQGWAKDPAVNPKGFFEDPILTSLLNHAVGGWRHPRLHPTDTVAVERWGQHRDRVSALWGAKEGRLCMAGHALLTQHTKVVVVTRDPVKSAASVAKVTRYLFPVPVALHLVCLYWEAMVNLMSTCEAQRVPMLGVQYERLVQQPEGVVASIAEFLELSCTPQAVDFVDPTLNHYP